MIMKNKKKYFTRSKVNTLLQYYLRLAAVVEWSKVRNYLAYLVDHYLASWVRLPKSASPQKENWCILIKRRPLIKFLTELMGRKIHTQEKNRIL